MVLASLALLGSLCVQAQLAPPPVADELRAILGRAHAFSIDEDADPESFGIDGPELLPNFHQVHAGLYRSGQPSREGLAQLKALGVRTILSVRGRVGPEEKAEAERLGMRWVNIPVYAWWRPSRAQIQQFLAIARDPAQRPVFVHCRFGQNRSGMMVAAYRIVQQGWTPSHAYAEGLRLGMFPFNVVTRDMLLHQLSRTANGTTLPAAASRQENHQRLR